MLDLLVLLNFLSVIGALALQFFLVLRVVSVMVLHLLKLAISLIAILYGVVLGLLHSSFVLGLEAAWLQAFKLLWD